MSQDSVTVINDKNAKRQALREKALKEREQALNSQSQGSSEPVQTKQRRREESSSSSDDEVFDGVDVPDFDEYSRYPDLFLIMKSHGFEKDFFKKVIKMFDLFDDNDCPGVLDKTTLQGLKSVKIKKKHEDLDFTPEKVAAVLLLRRSESEQGCEVIRSLFQLEKLEASSIDMNCVINPNVEIFHLNTVNSGIQKYLKPATSFADFCKSFTRDVVADMSTQSDMVKLYGLEKETIVTEKVLKTIAGQSEKKLKTKKTDSNFCFKTPCHGTIGTTGVGKPEHYINMHLMSEFVAEIDHEQLLWAEYGKSNGCYPVEIRQTELSQQKYISGIIFKEPGFIGDRQTNYHFYSSIIPAVDEQERTKNFSEMSYVELQHFFQPYYMEIFSQNTGILNDVYVDKTSEASFWKIMKVDPVTSVTGELVSTKELRAKFSDFEGPRMYVTPLSNMGSLNSATFGLNVVRAILVEPLSQKMIIMPTKTVIAWDWLHMFGGEKSNQESEHLYVLGTNYTSIKTACSRITLAYIPSILSKLTGIEIAEVEALHIPWRGQTMVEDKIRSMVEMNLLKDFIAVFGPNGSKSVPEVSRYKKAFKVEKKFEGTATPMIEGSIKDDEHSRQMRAGAEAKRRRLQELRESGEDVDFSYKEPRVKKFKVEASLRAVQFGKGRVKVEKTRPELYDSAPEVVVPDFLTVDYHEALQPYVAQENSFGSDPPPDNYDDDSFHSFEESN